RVSLKGTVGEQFNLAVSSQSIPLSIAEILRPGAGLAGTLAGEASLHGDLARPEGSYQLSVSHVATPRTRGAGLPPIDASASGTLAEDGGTLDASASAGAAAGLRATGRVPWRSAGPIALRISGQADAALANAALQGQLLTGRMKLDADLRGTLGAPQIEGTATLVGGTFTDPRRGSGFGGMKEQAPGGGDTLRIGRFPAAPRTGGRLSAVGRIPLAPPAGFPAQIRLRASQAELLANEIVAAVANLD